MSPQKDNRKLTVAEALREAITEEMERDKNVYCIGEDIAVPGGWGGAFTVTLNMEEKFPERMINTPISETAIFGAALGSAVKGMRPIADVQYGDFLFCAMDQIANQIAIMRYMSGGKVKVPITMRAPVGATTRGPQHAHSMESWFINIPGIKVICPSNAYDAKGMLKSAIRDDNPVLVFEHKRLYGSKNRSGETQFDASRVIPEEDFTVPIGEASIIQKGTDITILSTLFMLHRAKKVAEELEKKGISCEVIDLRSLVPLDQDTILKSIKKTGKAVIVEECTKRGGWGAEVGVFISESIPEYLLAPIKRIAAFDTPAPFAPEMEKYYVPSFERIKEGIIEVLDY